MILRCSPDVAPLQFEASLATQRIDPLAVLKQFNKFVVMIETAFPVNVYQLRVVIRGIIPLIWRRLLLRSDSTLANLHYILQTAFGWEDYHLHRFTIRGEEYGFFHKGGVLYSGDAHQVTLSDFHFQPLEKFIYEYDFGDRWIHDIRVESILSLDSKKHYPCCTGGKRAGPPEDCGGPVVYMEQLGIYRYIIADDGLDEFCDYEDDALEILRRYDHEKFDQHRLNDELRRLVEAHPECNDHILDSANLDALHS